MIKHERSDQTEKHRSWEAWARKKIPRDHRKKKKPPQRKPQRKQKVKMLKHKQKMTTQQQQKQNEKMLKRKQKKSKECAREARWITAWRRQMKQVEDIVDVQNFAQWTKRKTTSGFTTITSNTTWTTARTKERKRCTTARMRMENRSITWSEMRKQERTQKELKARPQKPRWTSPWRLEEWQVKNILIAAQWMKSQITPWVIIITHGAHIRSLRQVLSCFMSATTWTKGKNGEEAGETTAAKETEEISKKRRGNPKTHWGEEKHTPRRETTTERSEQVLKKSFRDNEEWNDTKTSKEYSKTSKAWGTSQESNLQRRKCSSQR